MTLKALIEEGHELEETRVLIAVKSIGAVKKITSKKDPPTTSELVEVICFDDTAEIILLLWRETAMSAKDWRASETLLLLTRPSYRQIGKWGSKSILSLTAKSMVDVDPSSEWQDAKWLRTWLSDLRKKECLHQPSLDGIFDELLETDDHALFSLRDIDQWVRESPKRSFVGWLSLVVLNLNLSLMIARSMLCVSECCGIPIYANLLSGTCKQCDKIVPLALNPGIVGKLLDETGDIGQGKLVWTEEAWEMLWGRSVDELCVMGSKEIGLLESRVLGLRFSFLFGWEESIGRLAVLEVRM